MDFRKKYYGILGIGRNASAEEMRATYRSLVKQYHPDRNPSPEAAEKIKEINEAYEVLSNPESRKIYDAYDEPGEASGEFRTQPVTSTQKESKKRMYERRYTVQKTEKLFIWGRIFIKFCADSVGELESLTERNYAIYPTATEVLIHHHGISREPTSEYISEVARAVPLQTHLRQPVLCRLHGVEEVWYKLELQDVCILDPKLTNVIKHNAQSFGTLEAEMFAYILKTTEEEKTELVTECYGETGRTETRLETGWYWKRTEYYKPDCSTYWSDWVKTFPEPVTSYTRTNKPRSTSTGFSSSRKKWYMSNYTRPETAAGCVDWLWIPLLVLFVIAIPQLLLPLLVLGALWLLIRFGQGLLARSIALFSLIFIAIIAAAIVAALRNNYTAGSGSATWRKTPREKAMPERVNVWKVDESKDSAVASENDEYISHLVKWVSYDSTPYEAVLSVRVASIQSSAQFHAAFLVSSERTAWKEIFNGMEQKDRDGLREVYSAFDSIRQTNGLNEKHFAEMMVCAIQSIPYFLVTSNDCETAANSDPFVQDFLGNCELDCCVGNTKFGIRSPLEFLSDLKGDCDTRALFLYILLKHFGYNVALMTSEHYRHAAIAVHFKDGQAINGSILQINGKNYYPWETTNKGFKPGVLPEQCNDLNYWNIVLVNE